jgi:hypothetical protein
MNGQGWLTRRHAFAAALALFGIVGAVALIIATGSVLISALGSGDPISIYKSVIPFNVVIPGEEYPDDFTICIQDPVPGDHVDYTLTLSEKPLVPDMRPFLVVVADDPTEPDPLADGGASPPDYDAAGELDEGSRDDECDTWQTTLTAPHCEDAYNPYTDPQGGGATPIPCLTEKPTSDPQTWITGSALGAEVEINATVP